MGWYEDALYVREQSVKNNEFFGSALPLIASENILSPLCKEMLITDFHGRYAEGTPGNRYYEGCEFFDKVELKAIELAKKLFKCNYADVRPTAGTTANMAVLKALIKPGETATVLDTADGAHISFGKWGAAGLRGVNLVFYPFDNENMNIDVDGAAKVIREVRPKLALFGQSVFLFPTPLKELAEVAHEVGAYVVYDAAHVLGLIAAGYFQDPLREGADVMSGSTHKTLPGPQGGIVVSWEKYAEVIKRATFPGNVSNHHLHHVAGKAIAFAEMLVFGRDYARQIVRNSKALAQALYERGIKVLGEKKGFTESHVVIADVTKYGNGAVLEKRLEEANIVLNRNLLPYDIRFGRHFQNPGGIRMGTQECTRLGMKESEMVEIAELIKRVVVDGEDPGRVRRDVIEFRKNFQKVHYCFPSARKAYEYIGIR